MGFTTDLRWKGTSYNLILVIVGLNNEPVQISRCTQAARDNFRRCNPIPLSPRLSVRDLVFTSKFWSPRYCFQVWLRSPPIRLLQKHWIEISWLHRLDIANLFLPDLWGYMHGFSYWLIYELVWQIPFRRIFEVTCMDLAINQHDVSQKIWFEGMANLSSPDFVKFWA